MDQQKCIFIFDIHSHIYQERGEEMVKYLRTVSLDLESVGGYYVSVIFLVDMKSTKIKRPGKTRSNQRSVSVDDLNDIELNPGFHLFP